MDERRRAQQRANTPPPAWLVDGVLVDYHSVIGGPVTRPSVRVRGSAFKSESGAWVVFLDGVSGYVACAAVKRAGEAA